MNRLTELILAVIVSVTATLVTAWITGWLSPKYSIDAEVFVLPYINVLPKRLEPADTAANKIKGIIGDNGGAPATRKIAGRGA
jgi:hypothetical protein